MEKRVPHYRLADIQRQMQTVADMNLSLAASHGIQRLRMSMTEALAVIQALSPRHFHKSMTTYLDHQVWQDVYHMEYRRRALYVKFQRAGDYFVISFKERTDDR